MKKLVKEQWIEALRSGEYEKCTGSFCKTNDHDAFCAIGVLMDLWVRKTEGAYWDQMQGCTPGCLSPRTRRGACAEEAICKWAGLKNFSPTVDGYTPIHWNDAQGLSFLKLAGKVEAEAAL